VGQHIPLVKFLLQHGAFPNEVVLRATVKNKDLALLRLLIERIDGTETKSGKKRRLSDRITDLQPVLYTAVKYGAKDIIQWLINEKGVVPSVQLLKEMG
jgi:hypothetical protein